MSENYNMELIRDVEELIKRYNKKPDKDVQKKDIVTLLQKASVLVPGKVDTKLTNLQGDALDNIGFQFDTVKKDNKVRLLPVFTSFDQVPDDYLDTFSFIKINADKVYKYTCDSDHIGGIVVNPFTEYNFEVKNKQLSKKSRSKIFAKDVDDDDREAIIVYDNKKYPIKKTPFTIGREGTNVEIPANYISKIHVVISYKDGKYRIADYDSTNGTKLNGTPLKSKVYYEVRDGYEIELAEKEKLYVYIN